jgi:hypothetical protein
MQKKKQGTSKKKVPEKKSLKQAINVSKVVGSLGASLGIDTTNLFAAQRKSPSRGTVQQKSSPSLNFGNINTNQIKLSDQIKMTEAQQLKLWNQVKLEAHEGKFAVSQLKLFQANELKLQNRIKLLQADEWKMSNQGKILLGNLQKDYQANQIKLHDWEAKEQNIANLIKTLGANELKLSSQLKAILSNLRKDS